MFDFFNPPEPSRPENVTDAPIAEAASPRTAEPVETSASAADSVPPPSPEPAAAVDEAAPEAGPVNPIDPIDPIGAIDPTPDVSAPATPTSSLDEVGVDLPDFSHEPTEPGQYTLRIVFTVRPGDQSVLVATQSHDVLPIVGELEPTHARALLAPFIAAHEARLSEIKAALAKPTTKPSSRNAAAKKPATPATTAKPSGARKPKTVQPPAAKPPATLPQTNLFTD